MIKASVFMFCLNGAKTIRRAVESVLNQNYENLEFIVQDGGSTDGTLEILKEYEDQLSLRSEPDSCPAEGFSRAINRCTGELIGSCLADEELLPDAVDAAAKVFEKYSDLSAITRDAVLTDIEGNEMRTFTGREFTLVEYLEQSYVPHFSATFFSKQALVRSGFFDKKSSYESIEFDLWVGALREGKVAYVQGVASKYCVHSGQLSRQPENAFALMKGRIDSLERLFRESRNLFGGLSAYRRCVHSTIRASGEHLLELGDREIFLKWIEYSRDTLKLNTSITTSNEWTSAILQQLCQNRFEEEDYDECVQLCSLGKRAFPENPEFTRLACLSYLALFRVEEAIALLESIKEVSAWADMAARLQIEIAVALERRGDLELALPYYANSNEVEDSSLQSYAVAAQLKLGETSSLQLLEAHDQWAEKFLSKANGRPIMGKERLGSEGKIKIGFTCSSLEETEELFQLRAVVDNLDTKRFEPLVYLNSDKDLSSGKGDPRFKGTRFLSDNEFVEQCRADGLDILVEMDGHSRRNRLVAMSQRCAPIQMSLSGYAATTGVREIDYLIADSFACCEKEDAYFVESILPIEGGSYCFDFSRSVPTRQKIETREDPRPVTFGCFSSLSRIDKNQLKRFADVLDKVPGARLVIQNRGLDWESNRRKLACKIEALGLDSSRILLKPATTEDRTLENSPQVDIALDTYPCSDPWAMAAAQRGGMIAVTCCGDRLASRRGASVLRQLGRDSFIATSEKAFLDLCENAVSSLSGPSVKPVETTLEENSDGLTNPKRFADRLGACFEEAVRRYHVSRKFYHENWESCLPEEARCANVFKDWVFITSMPRSGTWYTKFLFHVMNHRLAGGASMAAQPPHLRAYEGLGINAFHSHAAHWMFNGSDFGEAYNRYHNIQYVVEGYDFGSDLQKEIARTSGRKTKTVYIYRNPLDHCISMYRHLMHHVGVEQGGQGREGGYDSAADYFRSGGLHSYLKQFSSHYHVEKSGRADVILVRYEELISSPSESFERATRFMLSRELTERERGALAFAVEVVVPENLKAIERLTGGSLGGDQKKKGESHMRGGSVGTWRDHFTADDLAYLKREVGNWGIPLSCFDFGAEII